MGYDMEQRDASFFIARQDRRPASGALKALAERESLRWVNQQQIRSARSLATALLACGWRVKADDEENIVGISWEWGKAGDDLKIFQAIAPWVRSGSYVEMLGDGGYHWRWVFNRGECIVVKAEITFSSNFMLKVEDK